MDYVNVWLLYDLLSYLLNYRWLLHNRWLLYNLNRFLLDRYWFLNNNLRLGRLLNNLLCRLLSRYLDIDRLLFVNNPDLLLFDLFRRKFDGKSVHPEPFSFYPDNPLVVWYHSFHDNIGKFGLSNKTFVFPIEESEEHDSDSVLKCDSDVLHHSDELI